MKRVIVNLILMFIMTSLVISFTFSKINKSKVDGYEINTSEIYREGLYKIDEDYSLEKLYSKDINYESGASLIKCLADELVLPFKESYPINYIFKKNDKVTLSDDREYVFINDYQISAVIGENSVLKNLNNFTLYCRMNRTSVYSDIDKFEFIARLSGNEESLIFTSYAYNKKYDYYEINLRAELEIDAYEKEFDDYIEVSEKINIDGYAVLTNYIYTDEKGYYIKRFYAYTEGEYYKKIYVTKGKEISSLTEIKSEELVPGMVLIRD